MRRFMLLLLGATLLAGEADQLLNEGMTKMMTARSAAMAGKFNDANAAIKDGSAALDKAVAMEPTNYKVRKMRAMLYGHLPAIYNKRGTAREDVQFVLTHHDFASESDAFKKQIEAIAARLVPDGQPDRFPKVSAEMSPIIVSATVTSPSIARQAPGTIPPIAKRMLDGLEGCPGLLGVRALTSVDAAGQIVILTWWKDKAALNNWFYSEAHQGMIREAYGRPEGPQQTEAVQVAIELFTSLPGGTRLNGGLVPESVIKK